MSLVTWVRFEQVERIGCVCLKGALAREKALIMRILFIRDCKKTGLSGLILFPSLPFFIPSILIELKELWRTLQAG